MDITIALVILAVFVAIGVLKKVKKLVGLGVIVAVVYYIFASGLIQL